jgi:hypothetical protein
MHTNIYINTYICFWVEGGLTSFTPSKMLKVFGRHNVENGISNPGQRVVVCYYSVTSCEGLAWIVEYSKRALQSV